ncbi:hypothetical protein EYF80_027593 [Liparis tanakae]|uniref:Uncharacterized protein n=1 Tax=Liparis tanakae TaxID=230148 RepID=A0A4Z2HB34_9TELE|nr:hypothetical protein EYF80_027593 [Liparis tanakae]
MSAMWASVVETFHSNLGIMRVLWVCPLGLSSGSVLWVCPLGLSSGSVLWVCPLGLSSGYLDCGVFWGNPSNS